MNQLQQVTARMLEIERENMAYNKATTFSEGADKKDFK